MVRIPLWEVRHKSLNNLHLRKALNRVSHANSDAKGCIPSGNCLCFVLDRRGSVPGESPLLCLLDKGNADKDWLAYPFPGFLRQDEVHKPSGWLQLIYVIYARVLPQLVCTFAIWMGHSYYACAILLISIRAMDVSMISILLCCCSDLIVGHWEILFLIWLCAQSSNSTWAKFPAGKKGYMWVWTVPVSAKM